MYVIAFKYKDESPIKSLTMLDNKTSEKRKKNAKILLTLHI